MKLLMVLSVVFLLGAAQAGAQDIRSEKYPRPGGTAAQFRPGPEPRTWEVTAGLGITSDANISHLLVNSQVNSNARVKDNIRHISAGFSAEPAFAKKTGLELSYSFDDYAYRTHTTFSYKTHSLSAGIKPGLAAGWKLDLGLDLDLVGDKTGTIADDSAAHAGLIWYGPAGLRVKGGYERRRDNVRTNPLKDADTNAAYLSANRRFLKRHLGFASLRWQAHAAAGPDYSFKSRSAILGLISKWTAGFKLVTAVVRIEKDYDNVDTRFLKVRHDATDSVMIKPVFTLTRGLSAVGSFTYMDNHSNVSMKNYSDRIYSVGLEGRF